MPCRSCMASFLLFCSHMNFVNSAFMPNFAPPKNSNIYNNINNNRNNKRIVKIDYEKNQLFCCGSPCLESCRML